MLLNRFAVVVKLPPPPLTTILLVVVGMVIIGRIAFDISLLLAASTMEDEEALVVSVVDNTSTVAPLSFVDVISLVEGKLATAEEILVTLEDCMFLNVDCDAVTPVYDPEVGPAGYMVR